MQQNLSGTRDNTYDGFTGLWDGATASTNHAQYREYSNVEGRWLSPDPYSGSYDFSNPQSFNRYTYAMNNPLTFTDPAGLVVNGSRSGQCNFLCAFFADVIPKAFSSFFGLFGGPSFHGSLQPRPNVNSTLGDISANMDGTFTLTQTVDVSYGPHLGLSASGLSAAPNNGTITPSSIPSDAQYRCINGLFIKSAIAGVGSALGVQPPGSDPAGNVADAVKGAARNPVVAMSAGAMAARLGGALLSRAGALELGEAITTKFVPGIGWLATAYGTYTAISDGIDYFNDNEAACHDAK